MAAGDALAVDVDHTDGKRRICRHLYHDRAIRLDHRVAHDFTHALLGTDAEVRVVEIHDVIIRYGYGLFDSEEAKWSIRRKGQCRIGHCRNIDNCTSVEIVNATNINDRLAVICN